MGLLAFDADKLLIATIIGISTGAIYAVIASGLVVTYNTSGLFNLAHGATGVLAAFTYWQFRFGWGWPTPLALLIVLGLGCPLYGWFVERFVMRGLRNTTEVVRLSVTVALFAAVLGLVNWLWPTGPNRAAMVRFYEGRQVSIGGINVAYHKLITMGCAVLVAIFLRLLMYRSRTGVAMRAVVDDRDLGELNGAHPDRIAGMAWAVSAVLAGVAGILLAGEQGIRVEPLVLLTINAYAAAIIGRLRSLPRTFIGALLLGLLDSYYLSYSDQNWFPKTAFGFSLSGLRASIPTIVLFVALVLMPQSRLRTGISRLREKHREPAWSTALIGTAVLVGFTVAVSGMMNRPNSLLFINALLFSIAALSLVPLTGYAGQVSLAPLSFAGLGAIAMAKVPGNGNLLSLLLTMVIVGAVGALVALPALRLTGVYLALSTAAFAVLVSNLVFNQKETFYSGNIAVPPLRIPGLEAGSPRARMIVLAIAFGVLGLLVVAVRRSRLGRRLIAIKDSPAAAATLGMNVTGSKVAAFAISAAIASCAGALAGSKVSPQQYDFLQSLPVVLLTVLGGVAAVSGALLGGFFLGGNSTLQAIAGSKFVKDFLQVLPGTMGITLGRSPAGVTEETSEGFRGLIGRWNLIAIAIGGGVVLWALTTTGAVTRWGFVASIAAWSLTVVPLLPALANPATRRRPMVAAVLAAGVAVAALLRWGTVIHTSGWRLIAIIALLAAVIVATSRIIGPAGSASHADAEETQDAAATVASPALVRSAVSAVTTGDSAPLLVLDNVSSGYGSIEILHGVTLSIGTGDVMAILGPNGAGKSTLIRTACGQLPLLGGARLFNGADVSAATPRHLVRNGLCTIPEGRGIFPNLTVRENLWMATYRDTNLADVEEMTYAQFPRLGERRSQLAGTMSGGEQQMLSLARALTTKPRVLLLDELSMGLAPMIVSELYEQVGRIAASGVAVLLVEQFASTVDKVANRSVLLTNGTIRWAGTPGELAGQDLTELYFGETSDSPAH